MAGASGHSGASCVLCPAPAAVYCRNDGVILCAECDAHTHGSEYLSRHERVPLPYLPPADRARVFGGDGIGTAAAACMPASVLSEGLSHAHSAVAVRQTLPATSRARQHNIQPSAARHKSFLVGRAAPSISSSPFSFLSKLQPPPTLPAQPQPLTQHPHQVQQHQQLQHQRQQLLGATSMLRAGSSAGSDDTLWQELPPTHSARLHGGNIDAALMDCLEAFAGEQQLDLRLDPEAATCGVADLADGRQACEDGASTFFSTSSVCEGLYRQHSAADDLFDSVRNQLYSAAAAAKAGAAAAAEHRSSGAGPPAALPHINPFAAQLAMAGRQAGTTALAPADDSFEQELRDAADRLLQQQQALLRHHELERQHRQQQQQQQMEQLRLRHLQQLRPQPPPQPPQQLRHGYGFQQQAAAVEAERRLVAVQLKPATLSNRLVRSAQFIDTRLKAAPDGSPTSAFAANAAAKAAAAEAAAEPSLERGGSCLWPAAVPGARSHLCRATSAPLHAAAASLSSPRVQAAAGGSLVTGGRKPSAAASPQPRPSPAAAAVTGALPAQAAVQPGRASTVVPAADAKPAVHMQAASPAVAPSVGAAAGNRSCRSPVAAQPGSPFKIPPSRLGMRRPQRSSAVAAAAKTAAMMAAEADAETEAPQALATASAPPDAKQKSLAAAPPPTAQQLSASGSGELAGEDDPMHGARIVIPQYREGEGRAEKLERYRMKKLRRKFQPTVRYQCRKHYADSRPRVRGRFVSPEEFAAWQESQGGKAAC